jgi:rRNA-processing protein FCF1
LVLVVFDSSFLMAVVERPTTWFEDMTQELGKIEPVVPDCVLEELVRISGREGRRSKVARVAGDLASSFKKVRCTGAKVDDCVIDYARKNKAVVATVDSEMIDSLKRSRRRVVTLHRGRVAVA